MAERLSDNLLMLMRVVDRLTPWLDRFVFLGGAVTELFITASGLVHPRQTEDVDLVVDVTNHGAYSETLREGSPVCRWILDDTIVDIMPTRGDILDFSCEWR